MAGLTQNIEILLDRLYNLKGEDNVLLKRLATQIETTEGDISNAEADKSENEINKVNCEGKLALFLAQKQTFEEAFHDLDNDTFSALREIDVNLEIGSLLSTIAKKSPEYCENLRTEIASYETAISEANGEKERLEQNLAELNDSKRKSENDREQLISLLEQSLSPNEIERDSLTAHYVKRILDEFGVFTEDELNKLTKLIMFPDEGLYQFDQTYANRLENGLVGVYEDKPQVTEEPTEEFEQEHKDIVAEEIIPAGTGLDIEGTEEIYGTQIQEQRAGIDNTLVLDLSPLNASSEITQEGTEEPEEQVIVLTSNEGVPTEFADETETATFEIAQEQPADSVEEISEENTIEKFLKELGLDLNRFEEDNASKNIEEIYALLASKEQRLVSENYEILRSLSLEDEAYKYRFGHIYLADSELNKKLTILRAKGIKESIICDLIKNSNSGLRETYDVLETRIKAIESLYQRFDEEYVHLLQCDMVQYVNNLDILTTYGFELDEKEIRNHSALLFHSSNIPINSAILKDYLISIVRNNGKYALSVFWKTPTDLVTDIDSLIEADLENIIATNPEILGTNSCEAIRRVKYCEELGEPIYEGNGNTEFCKHIPSHYEFDKRYGAHTELPRLVQLDEVNPLLANIIGNTEYTEILINTLDEAYRNLPAVLEMELDPEMTVEHERLSHILEDNYGAKVIGKYTYQLGDVYISKNKFERNLTIILNALAHSQQPVSGVEREIILASALYNLRQNEETLTKVAGSCLGFNESNTVGGMTL